MSEPRLISPMLDGYALGGAISAHSGVRCFPAMRADSDERYIVKTISIPPSQIQLEALLLTGAYKSTEDAQGYFKELAKGVRGEIEVLDKLAAHRGFLPYTRHQIVPMEDGVGYDIYLISPYRPTLERHLKRSPLTYLSAVNLGIDLCAALAVCREAGYLYVDLKPSNIFLPGVQEYYIGDLGFVALDSLKYASLPDRYRSCYTAPEVADAYATLNTTMDLYALGLVLYQVYNNGQLPFDSEESRKALMDRLAAGEALPPPAYADYEMAEIILKACAYNPADRWQTPADMGRALISYMQRNGANDVPIGPPVIPDLVDEEPAEPEEDPEVPAPEETPAAEPESGEDFPPEADASEEPSESDAGEPLDSPDWIDRMDAILAEDLDGETDEPDDGPSLRELLGGDDYDTQDGVSTEELSDETAGILNQAQALIDHDTPEPAVAPEPIDIPMPDPIVLDEPAEKAITEDDIIAPEPISDDIDDEDEDEYEPEEPQPSQADSPKPKKRKRYLAVLIVLILLAALAFGGYYYYSEYYLQNIDSLTIDGQADQLTVNVVTKADQSLLTVVCVDTYGNPMTATLENGKATFTDLKPGSQYMVSLQISGFHELTGQSTASYSTPERTQIMNLSAITGAEDGSAILSFTVEGPESDEWTLTYSAEGEEPQIMTFTGHTVNVTGLTVGAEYTFALTGDEDLFLIGENSITFQASAVIYAQNLTITGYSDGSLTAGWTAPEGTEVSGWTVRCYNEDGYDKAMTVTEPTATFDEIDSAAPYTIDVTAVGMTQSVRIHVTANPVTITRVNTDVSTDAITVTWDYEGVDPEGGWLMLYTVDSGTEQQIIKTDEAKATISPVAPGSHYDIIIQSANATSVFGGTGSADAGASSGSFSGYGMSASNMNVSLYPKPDKSGWTRKDVGQETSTFSTGDQIAVVYYTSKTYNISYADITTLYVFRDAEGKLAAISSSTRTWKDMWDGGYCTGEISTIPAAAGSYTLEIYFNNALVTTKNITIE